uniref:DNA/RNA-binding protein KIN17 n=1 Tax=Plectus sambesii TaxID=2011161 RepID=A0A914WTT4_9BILA
MPKHEKNSPKAIANKIKSKGLQKLKWFCQMCQKQCRDQNGFKCHLTSETHQRQLLLFADNQNSYLREFSGAFEKAFMDILRLQYGGKRIRANDVYQEYIKQKEHVHMNSTHWHSLTGFVMYLGRTGKCKIDQTEKGWFVQYIDKEEEMRKEKLVQKIKHDKDDEEKILDFVQRQAERALEALGEDAEESMPKPTDLIKSDDQKIEFALAVNKKPTALELGMPSSSGVASAFTTDVKPNKRKLDDDMAKMEKKSKYDDKERDDRKRRSDQPSSKMSALDEIRDLEERKKEAKNRKDYWLHENIVVKVVTKKLGGDYYKKKGIVESLADEYTANVRILDDKGDVLKLDQVHLETVIPALGRHVMIVNGAYRGQKALLEKIDEKNFCVSVRVDEGAAKGRLLEKVAYEDVSKLDT